MEEQSKLGVLKFNIQRDFAQELPRFFKKLEAKKKHLESEISKLAFLL